MVFGVEGVVAGGLQGGNRWVELTGDDFLWSGGDVAELAGSEIAIGGPHGRAEGTADDGAMLVEVAGAGSGVQDGAGLVLSDRTFGFVGEEEGVFVAFVENSGVGVSGKERFDAGERFGHARPDELNFFSAGLLKCAKTFAEAGCVLLGDREDAMAALRATGVADEMGATTLCGRDQGCVYDLDEVPSWLDTIAHAVQRFLILTRVTLYAVISTDFIIDHFSIAEKLRIEIQ